MIKKMKLKDVGIIITGNTPSKKNEEYYNSKDINFFTPTDFKDGRINNFNESVNYISNTAKEKARILPEGSVLVTCIGIIGKVGIIQKESAFNQQINAIIPNNNIIDNIYLAYCLISKADILRKKANAAVVPIINKTDFQELELDVPDLETQKEVVNKLNKIQNLIDLKEEQKRLFENLIKSQFVEMFGDPIFNNKNWKLYKWNDVLTIKNGKNQKKVEVQDGKYPIYGSGGIMSYANNYICNEDSVIIGRKGNINNPILIRTKFWNVDTAFGLEPRKDKMIVEYLYYFCCFYNFEKHNKAVTIPSLTKSDLLNIDIPIPHIKIQKEFTKIVKQIDKQKLKIQKSLELIYNLQENLMSKYFN